MQAKPNEPVYNPIMEHAESSGSNLIRTDTLDQGAADTLSAILRCALDRLWQQKGECPATPANGVKIDL